MFTQVQIDSNLVKGYKIKLYPTEEQKEILDKQMNLFRFVYNWGLNECQEYYNKFGHYIGKQVLFQKLSEFRNKTPWMMGIPLHSARLALYHLDNAYLGFFKYNKGFPKFKTKKYSKKVIHYRNEYKAFRLTANTVRLSGFPKGETIACKSHNIPFDNVQYYSCTVTFDGINYWLSVNIEHQPHIENEIINDLSIGIDVGIRKFAQLSNRIEPFYAPSKLRCLYNRYNRQRSRLRKMRNTRVEKANRAKTKLEAIPFTKNEVKLKSLYLKTSNRIKNIKNNFLHEVTNNIVNQYPSRIVIEDLNLTDMIQSEWNNTDDIFHSMWYRFREILSYKCIDRGIELVLADKHFPSSQICSRCGNIKKTSYREYICPICGLRLDRDLNAAINLSRYA